MVGAVLVKGGKVAGEGYHIRAGEDHAEIVALKQAGREARGSTLYINLEPCSHSGRTPPCAPALIEAGIKRVVAGMEDPNPAVKGRGLGLLRQAGLDVEVGILEKTCRALNEDFSKHIRTGEPFVILKAASTLDGKIATRQGESKWITGEASRRFVHRLRNRVDGIVVGIETILKDDPLLTARVRGGRDPYRIILDSRLRIPEKAKVLASNPGKTIIATTARAPRKRQADLERQGARVLVLDSKEKRVGLRSLLARLGEMEMISLLVEGGSEVNGSFLTEGLIDKMFLFLAPKIIGGHGAPGIFGGAGAATLEGAFFLDSLKVRKIGEDLLIEGYPKKRCLPES